MKPSRLCLAGKSLFFFFRSRVAVGVYQAWELAANARNSAKMYCILCGENNWPAKKNFRGAFFRGELNSFFAGQKRPICPTTVSGYVVRVRSRSTSSLAPSAKCKHVFDVSNCPTRWKFRWQRRCQSLELELGQWHYWSRVWWCGENRTCWDSFPKADSSWSCMVNCLRQAIIVWQPRLSHIDRTSWTQKSPEELFFSSKQPAITRKSFLCVCGRVDFWKVEWSNFQIVFGPRRIQHSRNALAKTTWNQENSYTRDTYHYHCQFINLSFSFFFLFFFFFFEFPKQLLGVIMICFFTFFFFSKQLLLWHNAHKICVRRHQNQYEKC